MRSRVLLSGLIVCVVAGPALAWGLPGLGSISGTVTNAAGQGLANICVEGFDAAGDQAAYVQTDQGGSYALSDLAPGDYRIRFFDCSWPSVVYLSQWYKDKADFSSADPVHVDLAAATTGIDAVLARGGSISGTVTDTSGKPVVDACIEMIDAASQQSVGWVSTNPLGRYSVGGLLTGTYKVFFSACGDSGRAPQWYDSKSDVDSADPVSVTAGADTPGIDAVMQEAPPPPPAPDLALSGLTVDPIPLQTDGGPAPSTGWVRRVNVQVKNLSDIAAPRAYLFVESCPQTAGVCTTIGSEFVDVPAGETLERSYEWNGFGTVGDVTITARIQPCSDSDWSNNQQTIQHYVIVGGTGFGVSAVGDSSPGPGYYPPFMCGMAVLGAG